jgi:hypothetical protein
LAAEQVDCCGAVVVMVRVAPTVFPPTIVTGLLEPKLKVGSYWALAGLEEMAAVRATAPVKSFTGVMLMDEVVMRPGKVMVADSPVMEKVATMTVTVLVPEAAV